MKGKILFPIIVFLLVFLYIFYDFNTLSLDVRSTLLQFRLQKLLLAVIVGAGLGLSGFVFQKVLNNKLADPYILGVATGSNLFVSIAVLSSFALNIFFIKLMAFLGAFLAIALLLLLSRFLHKLELVFILIGVSLNFIFSALNKLVFTYADAWKLLKISSFMYGNFADVSYQDILFLLFSILLVFALLWYFVRYLEIVSTGNIFARGVGLNYDRWMQILLILASFLVASITSVVGVIPFVGLLVPNVVELAFSGLSFRGRFLLNAFWGGLFMLFSIALSGILSQSVYISVAVVNSIIGAPFIIFVLYRTHRLGK